jgi:hypothetical protein
MVFADEDETTAQPRPPRSCGGTRRNTRSRSRAGRSAGKKLAQNNILCLERPKVVFFWFFGFVVDGGTNFFGVAKYRCVNGGTTDSRGQTEHRWVRRPFRSSIEHATFTNHQNARGRTQRNRHKHKHNNTTTKDTTKAEARWIWMIAMLQTFRVTAPCTQPPGPRAASGGAVQVEFS